GEQLLEGVQPALVVARGLALALGVGDLGDQLRLELAPLEAVVVAHRHGHPEDAALPRLVEHELAVLPRQRGGALHIGDLTPPDRSHPAAGAGRPPTATPIIASRVTKPASSASLSRSVPAGRSGSTRYLSSALESQMRISTFSGRSTPNSRSTTRGSRTARERYSNDLYQTGGRPMSACG